MCGRYYVDDDTAREIEKVVREVDSRINGHTGDICPAQDALIITGRVPDLKAEEMTWGFPQYKGSSLLINARAETVLERKMFRDSALHRRCVIPARGFYEWDRDKNQASFTSENGAVLYMAGFYNIYEGRERFIIITTEANSSVRPVHPRMPLILEEQELRDWIFDDQILEHILKKLPPRLKWHQEYEQQRLFPDL